MWAFPSPGRQTAVNRSIPGPRRAPFRARLAEAHQVARFLCLRQQRVLANDSVHISTGFTDADPADR